MYPTPNTHVIQGDMLHTAYTLKTHGAHVALFSFANPKNVPTGKNPGSQEATLSHHSGHNGDYYTRAIQKFRERKAASGTETVLGSGDTLFLKDVIFKGKHPGNGSDINLDVVLAAAPMLPIDKTDTRPKHITQEAALGKMTATELTEYMAHLNNTLEAVFLTAIKHGDKHLVLGEWGMGVFSNPGRLIIESYQNAVRLYGAYFEGIDFIIYGNQEVQSPTASINLIVRLVISPMNDFLGQSAL